MIKNDNLETYVHQRSYDAPTQNVRNQGLHNSGTCHGLTMHESSRAQSQGTHCSYWIYKRMSMVKRLELCSDKLAPWQGPCLKSLPVSGFCVTIQLGTTDRLGFAGSLLGSLLDPGTWSPPIKMIIQSNRNIAQHNWITYSLGKITYMYALIGNLKQLKSHEQNILFYFVHEARSMKLNGSFDKLCTNITQNDARFEHTSFTYGLAHCIFRFSI